MVNTTEEYWDVDGLSLNQLTQHLKALGGDRESVPDLRGDNRTIPYRPGDVWTPKVPDARDIELEGWMVDPDPLMLRTRWRQFRALLWRPEEQFVLTRRWFDAAGVLQSGAALGEYRSGMEPDFNTGQTRLEFRVKIRLADPFFYAPQISVPLVSGQTPHLLVGDYPSLKMTVELTGALTNARVSALLAGGVVDNTLTYSSVPAGATAVVNVETYRALEGTTKTSAKVSHSGRPSWLYLPRRVQAIGFAADAGAGTATVKYQPAFH